MPNFDENLLLALGSQPIAGAAPGGADASEEPEYITVRNELDKMDRIEMGEPEWYLIEQAAVRILQERSKDVLIASALALALFKRYRYPGLVVGLQVLKLLLENFWDHLQPERPRARKSRIEFVTDRFGEGGWFRENQPQPDEADALKACQTEITALTEILKSKLPDDPPDFSKFNRALNELIARQTAAAAPPPSPAAAPGAPAGAAPSAGASAGAAAGGSVDFADAGGAMKAILSACSYIRSSDPTHPVPYAAARAVRWATISLPTSDAGKYQIDPPDNALMETLTHQFSKGLWENLLKNAEGAFRSNDPLWLDLQRYVCSAMAGLGPPYEKARQAVIGATAALVRRLGEGLYDLRFKTGAALCSGETRMWIEAEVSPPARSSAGADIGNGRLTEAAEKARQLAASGQLKEALTELQEGLAGAAQRRERLMWRLNMGQLCCDSQKLTLAAPILEDCFEEIRRHHIEDWEPGLAVEVARALYRCRKGIASLEKQPDPALIRNVRESFAWLCQLDPLAALSAGE